MSEREITGDDIVIYEAEEWSALYVRGRLDRVGDSYLADERVRELLGITHIQDDAFLRGQDQRSGVAQTLEELRQFQVTREANRKEALRLQREANEMLRRAKELES